ncbi:MAG: hypothetical protein IJ160_01745 [Muribaculaceae bacterium]|nr:hypothetical protein [Muribaculaceae bacterium]
MTKFLLFIAMTCMGIGSVCAQVETATVHRHQKTSFSKSAFVSKHDLSSQRTTFTREGAASSKATRTANAPQHRAEGIIQQPEGQLYENLVYNYSSSAYDWWTDQMISEDVKAGVISLVEGVDGCLYIKGLLPDLYVDEEFWLKAENTEGNTYVIKPQPAGTAFNYETEQAELQNIMLLEMEEFESGAIWYHQAENPDITFTYEGGGRLRSIGDVNGDYEMSPTKAVGIVTESSSAEPADHELWDYYSGLVWNIDITPCTDVCNELPDGVTAGELIIKSPYGAGPIPGVFTDDAVYFILNENSPGWIKGTIDGDKVIVPGGQYLGIDQANNRHVYLGTATYVEQEVDGEVVLDPTISESMIFSYDAAQKLIDGTGYLAIITNGKATTTDELFDFNFYVPDPVIYEFQDVAAIPADPVINGWYDWLEWNGRSQVDFTLPLQDIDGNYIASDKLSYIAYADDNLFTFTPDVYAIDEPMTEIPYDFTGTDYEFGPSWFYFYTNPVKNFGIQSVYRGGGEENRSNIVWYELQTNGIQAVGGDNASQVVSEVCYDAAGRVVAPDSPGFIIKVMTFDDGTIRTVKRINK